MKVGTALNDSECHIWDNLEVYCVRLVDYASRDIYTKSKLKLKLKSQLKFKCKEFHSVIGDYG